MKPSYRQIAAGSALLVFIIAILIVQKYSSSVSVPVPKLASPLFSTQASTSTAATKGALATSTAPIKNTASTTKSTAQQLPSTPSNSTVQAREVTSAGLSLENALVNIVCLSNDPSIPSISGSGVLIDSRGIILTAAHVAQLFLLQDYLGTSTVQCVVRSGSPARRAYLAEPIYVSSSWLHANPNTLSTKSPLGNGQYDVALLGITATATSTPLPSHFPSIPLSSEIPTSGESVAIASYGAEYLTDTELNYDLYPILVFGNIDKRYTYSQDSVDLFSVAGSAASQEGSSGGGVADANGQLIGTITTSSIDGSIQDRTFNAVTTGHLRNTYQLDTGQSLDSALGSDNVSTLIANFHSEALQLGETLANGLKS